MVEGAAKLAGLRGVDLGEAREWASFYVGSDMPALLIYELGFNQAYFTVTFILLIQIVV